MIRDTTFEATYRHYPFSTLVGLGIALAAALKRATDRTGHRGATGNGGAGTGDHHLGHAA